MITAKEVFEISKENSCYVLSSEIENLILKEAECGRTNCFYTVPKEYIINGVIKMLHKYGYSISIHNQFKQSIKISWKQLQ